MDSFNNEHNNLPNQSHMGKTEQNKSVKAFNEQAANQEKTEKKEKEVEEEERNSDDENEKDRSDNSKDDISNSLLIESKEEGTNKTEKDRIIRHSMVVVAN